MNKNVWCALFILPFVCLAAWTASLAYQRNSGREVKMAVQGYDPRDLLSGHYIQYQIDWEKTDCSQFIDNICPKQDFCVEARWGQQCRFYIPETAAPKLDALFRKFRWGETDNVTFEVVYSYKPGQRAIARKLLINGEDWRKFKDIPEDK